MIIDIADVGHGACSVVSYPNGSKIMVDAGCRWDPLWLPSIEYFGQQFSQLILQNLDEDHCKNLTPLLGAARFPSLRSNPTVNAEVLKLLKPGGTSGMGPGVLEAYHLLRRYGTTYGPPPDLGPLGWSHLFWNRFGFDFTDGTNNLSMPVFFGYSTFTILFGGDLEKAGWQALLRIPGFKEMLAKVTVLVASHHGRDNGRCEEIFSWCRPGLVVMSDYDIRHDSQNTVAWYRNRVNGIPDYSVPGSLFDPPKRYVMTTRNDGRLRFEVRPDGSYTVYPERLLIPRRQGLIPAP